MQVSSCFNRRPRRGIHGVFGPTPSPLLSLLDICQDPESLSICSSPQSHQEHPNPCRSVFSLECMGLPKERKLFCVLGSRHPGVRVSNFSSCANSPPVQILSRPPNHVFLLALSFLPPSLPFFKT